MGISENNVAIQVSEVKFSFAVQQHGIHTFKEALLRIGREKPFIKKTVLNGVSFSIRKGECFAILGRNGSGKSTLLRLISGIIRPDEGSVTSDGRIAPLLALGVGLEPELSGIENIKLCGLLMGIPRSESEELVRLVQDFAELSPDDLRMQVKRYSSGMMARLAFSIAIAPSPEILIIDEVLAVGDAGFQEKCYRRIDEIRKQGSTIIFVSHSIGDVRRICTSGIVLDQGHVVCDGPVDRITEFYHKICVAGS